MSKEDKTKEKKKYEKPALKSQIYMEKGALACGKIGMDLGGGEYGDECLSPSGPPGSGANS